MKITGRRLWGGVMLLSCFVTMYQLLHKPQPVTSPQDIESARANAASFSQKVEQLQTARSANDAPAEVRFTSDEVNAEIAQSSGALPPSSATAQQNGPATVEQSGRQPSADNKLPADTDLGPGDVDVKDYQVKLDGDVARGQFVTQVAGKDVYVTLAGHLGSQDGYVTFDPTEIKIGDLSIPVSLVNSELQKKLAEQRGKLRLPDGVGSLRVENSELVVTQK
jgi:hypothetical protein